MAANSILSSIKLRKMSVAARSKRLLEMEHLIGKRYSIISRKRELEPS
jgi:hypothetical protein